MTSRRRDKKAVKAILNPDLPWLCDESALKDLEIRMMNADTKNMVQATPYSIENGIAYVYVEDFLFSQPNHITHRLGLISNIERHEHLQEIYSSDVSGIFMHIGSPGGEPGFLFEYMALMLESPVPLVTFTGTQATSAAMGVLVSGDYPVVTESAITGSIGVKAPKSNPYSKEYYMTSKNAKNKLMNDEQTKRIINKTETMFISAVMEATGKTHSQVVQHGNEGGILIGDEALSAGFVYATGTRDEAINLLNQISGNDSVKTKPANSSTPATDTSTETVDATANNERWNRLLAFHDGNNLEQIQTVCNSTMSTEDAVKFMETMKAPAPADKGNAPAQDANSELAKAVLSLATSQKQTHELIQKLAEQDGAGGQVSNPPHPDAELNDDESESTLSAGDIEGQALAEVESLLGKKTA